MSDYNELQNAKIRTVKAIISTIDANAACEARMLSNLNSLIEARDNLRKKLEKTLNAMENGAWITAEDSAEVESLFATVTVKALGVDEAYHALGNKSSSDSSKKTPSKNAAMNSPSPEAAKGVYDLVIFEDGTFTGMTT